MSSNLVDRIGPTTSAEYELLPKDRTILDRAVMEFRPFGLDERGHTIRDLSGMSIRAIILDLEKTISREKGDGAGQETVHGLCAMLNRRIKDPVYHVTPEILKNPWNSYSYEFATYVYEFCEQLTGDPLFIYKGGAEKMSPIIQVLARPFSLEQIYGMFPYFGNKFASGSIECRVVEVTPVSARLAMRFTDRTLRQFGPFRRRCAYLVCQSAQGIFAAVPERVHGLPPATLTNVSCIANDDEWCEWLIRWQADEPGSWWRRHKSLAAPQTQPVTTRRERVKTVLEESLHQQTAAGAPSSHTGAAWDLRCETRFRHSLTWFLGSSLAGVSLAFGLSITVQAVGLAELILAGLVPVLVAGLWINRSLRKESRQREALIGEQISLVESRHEELREAYLGQEQTRVELRRKVTQLTALHRAGLLFSSTLDRETLLQQVLETLIQDLHYDRAMVSFFDPARGVIRHARIIGVSPEVQAFVESCEVPVMDPDSPEGMVVLQGRPLLIRDIGAVRSALHPSNQRLVDLSQTKALVVVPLKKKDRILGTLTVDRTHQGSLTQDDVELMTTVANQVTIALDNAAAYQQIEDWNVGLELKVQERTAALQRADQLRSQFLSHVSHELKTPLTSINGFLHNLLDGLTGPLNDKQQRYALRMLENSDRLIRMIDDLLDRTSIEAGHVALVPAEVDVQACVVDAIEQLRPLAGLKRHRLSVCYQAGIATVWADRDRVIQIIVNLVQNAIKYTPEHGLITVTVESAGSALVRILVRDTGPGIPPDYLERIFDPFVRVPHNPRRGPKGLGLGLSIVKTLVELQGGRVTAGNHPQGGAEVSFTIPLRSTARSQLTGPQALGRKVLVADDDPDIRQWLLDRLKALGFDPHPAADGAEMLEAVNSAPYAGAILDIGMGPVDGLDVLQRIRRSHPHLPIVMITASGSQELAIKAIGLGAQAYLLKPFEAGELRRVMDAWFVRE